MTTEAQRLADELREALTIGREAAYEVAQNYHACMAGYRQYEHDRLDADVKKIDAAIGHLASMIPAEGLAEDTARIDWLENELQAHGMANFSADAKPNARGVVSLFTVSSQHVKGDFIRAAIDASMAASTPQGKETPDVQDR